jgi:hypothetical protein
MANKITCTCGHSWNKSDSSKKDMNVCHICGKDNTMKNGGWLDKYEQGGLVLKQKTHDNYGKKPNANYPEVTLPPGFVGQGYNIQGRNYSPAWGGQFQNGGNLMPPMAGADQTVPMAQKGTRQPIYTSDPQDPRLRNYQDSLNLYKAYQMQDKLMGPGSGPSDYKFKWTTDELKKGRVKKIVKGLEEVGPISEDFQSEKDQFKKGFNDFTSRREDKKLIDYYESLGFGPNQIMYHSSPDVISDKIRAIGTYFDGTANSPIYKKPVQPVVYKKPILEKPSLSVDLPNIELTDVRPSIAQPTFEQARVDMSKPTKYSYTYPTFDKDVQKTMYFPDRSSWKTFVEQQRGASSQEGKDYGSATGQFAMGGSIPGAVGFTYARTAGAAPSEGPYAKKTLPSAQDGEEVTYTHNPSGSREAYTLKRTVTPYTSKRDIRRLTQMPTDPRQVNFLSNYAGAIGEPGLEGFQYPTSVPFEGKKHWNIDRFIIDPQFGTSYPELRNQASTREEMRNNVLADMYKYNMLQNPDKRGKAWRQAKRFVRTEIDPRTSGAYYEEAVRSKLPFAAGSITDAVDESYMRGFGIAQSSAQSPEISDDDFYTADFKNKPITESRAKEVATDWLRNYKGLSKKQAKQYIQSLPTYTKFRAVNSSKPSNNTATCPPGYEFNYEVQECLPKKSKFGGVTETLPSAQDGLMTGKDYYEQWMNSPMYKQMLETSVQGPELERISQGRTKSYSLPYSVVPTNFEDPTVGGERRYRVRTPLTATSKELEEMTSALRYAAANPKDKDAVRKAKQIMEPTITGWDVLINKQFKPGTARYESTLAHELGHLTDAPFVPGKLSASDLKKFDTRDYIPASDKEKIKKYTENKTLDEYNKYLSNPKETRQFLNELRYVGKTQGIYDPFTEKITVDKFRKISGDQSPSKDALLHLYSEDEIVDMLNSISKAPQEGIPTAQNGQEMSFYQHGLDWTPRNISRNGGWLDKFEEGGEIVKDNEGYWNPQNWGKPVEINSNKITMEGVLEPLLGVSDTGDTQMMYPGKNYTFNGTKVVEYPREYFTARDGKSVNRADEYPLEKLDNLLNFTNYNKPQKAKNGWLDKYQ